MKIKRGQFAQVSKSTTMALSLVHLEDRDFAPPLARSGSPSLARDATSHLVGFAPSVLGGISRSLRTLSRSGRAKSLAFRQNASNVSLLFMAERGQTRSFLVAL